MRPLAERYLFKPAKVIDISKIDDAELQTHGYSQLMELVMKHVKEQDFEWMQKLDVSYVDGAFCVHMLHYLCSNLEPFFKKTTLF